MGKFSENPESVPDVTPEQIGVCHDAIPRSVEIDGRIVRGVAHLLSACRSTDKRPSAERRDYGNSPNLTMRQFPPREVSERLDVQWRVPPTALSCQYLH